MLFIFVKTNNEKIDALNAVNEMSKELDLEQLIEKLTFIENVQAGLKDENAAKTVNHDEVKERLKPLRP